MGSTSTRYEYDRFEKASTRYEYEYEQFEKGGTSTRYEYERSEGGGTRYEYEYERFFFCRSLVPTLLGLYKVKTSVHKIDLSINLFGNYI